MLPKEKNNRIYYYSQISTISSSPVATANHHVFRYFNYFLDPMHLIQLHTVLLNFETVRRYELKLSVSLKMKVEITWKRFQRRLKILARFLKLTVESGP